MPYQIQVKCNHCGKISPNPTAPEASDGMTYSFSGWVDAEGRTYTPEEGNIRITETQVFYAVYTATKASYTVTWDVEGTLTTETYEHGETPVYQGTPTKPGESGSDYTFVGWTPLIRPATQNVTYTAVFSEQKTFYDILLYHTYQSLPYVFLFHTLYYF